MNEMHVLDGSPGWWELLRALWPVFLVLASLTVCAIVLQLKSMFATREAHRDHDDRLIVVETFVIEQKTALGILPTRQELGEQITRQTEKITDTREELVEQLGEQSERIAGLEAGVKGLDRRLETTNTYLHTLIERGIRS
jgi:hypothetical protein